MSEIIYDFSKIYIDPQYMYNIKHKTEKLLKIIIEKYQLNEYISEKYRYRLDMEKYINSTHYEYYRGKLDINGNHTLNMSNDFDDWIKINIPDYHQTSEIYTLLCSQRKLTKEDLLKLNQIYKKYI